jgi:putative Mn2+ efflux pump MntP
MIWEAVSGTGNQVCPVNGVKLGELFLLALATSIDAFAVGITFSFLRIRIVTAVAIIGCTTFLLSVGGVLFGHVFGTRYEKKAEIAGGLILILIGLKILLQHLHIINF